MAIRTFYLSDDNLGLYGKFIITGIDNTQDTFIETGVQSQYGMVNFSKSYIRNQYSFGNSGIYLRKLSNYDNVTNSYRIDNVNTGASSPISAFGDSLIFVDKRTTTGSGPYSANYSNSFCKTLRKSKFSAYDSTGTAEDMLDRVALSSDPSATSGSFVLPIDKSLLGNYGYDIYMVYSKYEEILGEVFAIIKGNNISFDGKIPFGKTGSVFSVSNYGPSFSDVSGAQTPVLSARTMFHLGNLDSATGSWATAMVSDILPVTSVQPMVFLDSTLDFVAPSEYEFDIDDEKNMYIKFNTALTANQAKYMTIILFRDDTPEITLKTQNGFAGNGFYIENNDISYSIVNANYRVR